MSKRHDDRRPKRRRTKRRRRKRRRPTTDDRSHGYHPQLGRVVVVGEGEHCVITAPVHGGKTVIHRFETREEAEAQNRKNIEQDQPLVDFTDTRN